MENKNVIILRHHPLNVKFSNSFYTSQVEDDLSNYVIIDVTSRIERNKEFMREHPLFAKELSPFFIGPVISSDGVKANVFEIFWQCGKVYPCHDNNGKPTKEYFEWRNSFYSKEKCSKELMRHACYDLGYTNKDARYFAYYDKDLGDYLPLNYVEARKKVYFTEYAKLVYNTESFKFLKNILDSGKKLALVDFDGYNYYYDGALVSQYKAYVNKCKNNNIEPTLNEELFLKIKSLKEVVNCSYMLAGHAFVLKALLQGDIEVANGKIIDKTRLLD